MSDISDSCALVEVSALPSVFGSERAIVQLLRHLIENAIKFSLPMSIPQVRIFHTEVEGVMVFKVADNGIGVEETDHNSLRHVPAPSWARPLYWPRCRAGNLQADRAPSRGQDLV